LAYTSKKYWNMASYNHVQLSIDSVLFSDIFKMFITANSNKTVLEVGCAGGCFLCHLAKFYHLRAYGIDYCDQIIKVADVFRQCGLKAPTLFKEDFFSWQPEMQFDVVCSFGFIEHFEDFELVMNRQANLVKNGGLLIVSVPYFRKVQYLLHLLLDRENLRQHNIKVINLNLFRETLTKLGFDIELLSYYGTFVFWHENKKQGWFSRRVTQAVWFVSGALNRVLGKNRGNVFLSPYIICVAKKRPIA
jgi:SAM-dependent methyltransferase